MITYSFVIPHHNTPVLLQRLIDSIPQREDIEIIVVDDNSDEDKKATVKRPDVKTIFIDKEHAKGAGRARNVGMDAATGKWLLFADADDLYKPGFIDVLDEYKNKDIEVLFFCVDFVDSVSLAPLKYDVRMKHGEVVRLFDGSIESINNLKFFGWTPWHKMQRLSFVRKYGFRFEEVKRGNDVFFSFQLGYFVNKFEVDKRILYTVTYYYNSITFKKDNSSRYKDVIMNCRKRARFFTFIGHGEWNIKSYRGILKQSVLMYLLKTLKRNPKVGMQAVFYYLTHFYTIEKKANCYVDVIKKMKNANHPNGNYKYRENY